MINFLFIILGISLFLFPVLILMWFFWSWITLKQTPKEDKILYAKSRAQFIAASVVFGIEVAIVFMMVYLSFSNFSLM
ncbi:MAG: hypothetical protein IKH45_02225 [Neisseriaceae bacterium]|nr:hypothetical protein [Neisseriaceae bacterium]MBR3481690.1 hypothetical protein [Neisseriaceae bacterium]